MSCIAARPLTGLEVKTCFGLGVMMGGGDLSFTISIAALGVMWN